MKQLLGTIILLFPTCLWAQYSSHQGAAKFAPEDGTRFLIVGQDLGAVGGLDDHVEGYVDEMGQVPAGVTTYTGFPGLTGLNVLDNWGAGDVHAQRYLEDSTFDHAAIVIGLNLVEQLDRINSGEADREIRDLGLWILSSKRPVFLRIGYEFDGPWNGYRPPDKYRNAWVYIVEQFDALGVYNVAYVWQAHGGNREDIDRWYPGDAYVNWMGYSHFDEPDPGNNILAFAEERNKPVMICESAPRRDLKVGDEQEHWDAWYAPLFEKIDQYDRIKALAYINVDWDSQPMWQGQGWGDSRVQVNETVRMNWEKEMAGGQWIMASDSLFDLMQYALWRDSVVPLAIRPRHDHQALLVVPTPAGLSIRNRDHGPMDELRIWDARGSLLLHRRESNTRYLIPMEYLGAPRLLIIQVHGGGVMYRHKAILP